MCRAWALGMSPGGSSELPLHLDPLPRPDGMLWGVPSRFGRRGHLRFEIVCKQSSSAFGTVMSAKNQKRAERNTAPKATELRRETERLIEKGRFKDAVKQAK